MSLSSDKLVSQTLLIDAEGCGASAHPHCASLSLSTWIHAEGHWSANRLFSRNRRYTVGLPDGFEVNFSDALAERSLDQHVGGYRIDVLEPLRRLHLTCASPGSI